MSSLSQMEFGMQMVDDRAHFQVWKSWVNWFGDRFAVMHLNARKYGWVFERFSVLKAEMIYIFGIL